MGEFIEFLDIVLVVAAIQGLFLSVLLVHQYRNLFANRFISAFTALYSLILLNLILVDLNLFENWWVVIRLTEGIQFLIFPLFYLYARYLIEGLETYQARDSWHASAYIFYKIAQIPVFFKVNGINPEQYQEKFLHIALNWATIGLGLIYFVYTLIQIRNYSRRIRTAFSNIDQIRLNWLRWMTILIIFLLSLFMLENLLHFNDPLNGENYQLTSLLAAVYIYAFAYTAFSKSAVFSDPDFLHELQRIKTDGGKYKKSGLKDERADELIQNLEKLMETERLYLNSRLTLAEIADRLDVSSHNLSEAISRKLESNFFDFINRYRIEEVKKRFAESRNKHLTILAIGLDSGFNSKSSFNSIVKKYTGQTPSQLRDSLHK